MIDNYRNKCEFSIGYNADETGNNYMQAKKRSWLYFGCHKKESVIGFRLGDYKSGSNEVVEPFCCRHIPDEMKAFIRVMKNLYRIYGKLGLKVRFKIIRFF